MFAKEKGQAGHKVKEQVAKLGQLCGPSAAAAANNTRHWLGHVSELCLRSRGEVLSALPHVSGGLAGQQDVGREAVLL